MLRTASLRWSGQNEYQDGISSRLDRHFFRPFTGVRYIGSLNMVQFQGKRQVSESNQESKKWQM
jgi:hypothetical protein